MVERRNEGKQSPHFDLDINCNNWLWPPRILVKIAFSSVKHWELVGFKIISYQGLMMVLYIDTIFGRLISISFLPKVCKQKFFPQNTLSEGQSKRVWNEKLQRATESQIETGRDTGRDTGRETGREPVRTRESQIEPAGARVGSQRPIESQREPEKIVENCQNTR